MGKQAWSEDLLVFNLGQEICVCDGLLTSGPGNQ